MNGNITTATRELYEYYDSIRGKTKEELGDDFWDLVVLTASDELQRDAYEKQIADKITKKEIPSGVPYIVYADPPGPRAGCGGSTMYVLSDLEKKYGLEKLSTWCILLLNAGGQSQRLPSASVLGKIFSALPVGTPMYQMLDVKLAAYLPFLKKMSTGYFFAASDTIEVYDLGNPESKWDLKDKGFTALAHPSSLKIGTSHGVYVLEKNGSTKERTLVEQRVCLEVLQKPSIERMKEKGAVLNGNGIGDSELVYTDSSFSFDHEVGKKLLEFYRKEQPLNCEIDAYGDFLQALGPKATSEYTKDTKNVAKIEENLVVMRQKIYELLKGTPITVILLKESQFHHFGTISECLDNFCEGNCLVQQMGFNIWSQSKALDKPGENGSDCPTKAKRAKSDEKPNAIQGCVMTSAIHKDSSINQRSLVEYCHFEVPIDVKNNSLISNCEVLATAAKDTKRIQCPENSFLHTVPMMVEGKTKYATVAFACDDNLKKKVPIKSAGGLTYFGKSLDKVFTNAQIELGTSAFTDGSAATSLWSMKLFPLEDTMSESFIGTLELISALTNNKKYPINDKERVSMADVMLTKDVATMLKFRNNLSSIISS